MSKIDHSLFSAHEHALEQAYGQCPECQSQLQIKHGKSGAFLGCSTYPACHFSKPLHEYESAVIKQLDGASCPECGGDLAIKKGRFGFFVGCSQFPICHYHANFQEKHSTDVTCPSCQSGKLVERNNKYGKTFYACDAYPKCKYVLNHNPVAQACPDCGWLVLVKKQTAKHTLLECPQKSCGYTQEI